MDEITALASVTINGTPFHYRADSAADKAVIYQIFERKDYDLENVRQAVALRHWLDRQRRTPVIVDAGANIGAAAIWYAAIFPTASIVCVEPEAGNCELLRKNTAHLPAVTVIEGALGSYNGEGYLHDPGRGEWAYRVMPALRVDAKEDDPIIAVPVHTMRNIIRTAFGTPFIAKIDIEGGEAELFARNTAWVADFPLIVIELHDWMLPGQASSRNFLLAMGLHNFDVMLNGENLFCYNNDLLGAK